MRLVSLVKSLEYGQQQGLHERMIVLKSLRWLVFALCMAACQPQRFSDSSAEFTKRVAALAVLERLNADLLSHPSATVTLRHLCQKLQLDPAGKVIAAPMSSASQALPADGRTVLQITESTAVRYRHVGLSCGDTVLSEAENWYVPSRLLPEMVRRLDTTHVPFGLIVAPLHFHRQTLDAALLWQPLPDGWEMTSDDSSLPPVSPLPHFVLRHRAILRAENGIPFALVIENYTSAVLPASLR